MITKIYSTSRNTEVNSVCTNLSTAFHKTSLSSDTILAGFITKTEEKNASLSGAIKRLREKSKLFELDGTRDDCLRAVWFLVFGFTFHPDEAVSSAAKKVFAILENFGLQIINETYAIESAHIGAMLGQFATPDVQAATALLSGCALLIDRLSVAETAFEQARVEFETIKGNEGAFANASLLGKELLTLINEQLCTYINGMLVSDEATYGEFARTVAQIIADNNTNVRRRLTKKTEETTA